MARLKEPEFDVIVHAAWEGGNASTPAYEKDVKLIWANVVQVYPEAWFGFERFEKGIRHET